MKILKRKIKNTLDDMGVHYYENIIKRISKKEYVSFDIFDTLIKRDVKKPTDVFSIIEHNYKIYDFYKRRIEAEKIARKGKVDTTIDEIYDIYNELYLNNINEAEKIKNIEKQVEYELCVQNKLLKKVYDFCIENNKKVYLISDMYLSSEILKEILEKNGYSKYEKLYVSCEYNKTKANGELYKYIIQELGVDTSKLIHIGNDIKTDYIMALKNNISAVKVKTKTYTGNSLLDVFLSNHKSNSSNFYYDFGYSNFGPLLYGFCLWLKENVKKNNIDNIYFLARDGYIIKKAYEMIFVELDNIYYLEASRRSLRVPYLSQKNSIDEMLEELPLPRQTNMIQIFDALGLELDIYSAKIKENGYSIERFYLREKVLKEEGFKNLISSIKDDIIANSISENEALKNYLKKNNFSRKNAIVDIGWGGSMQKYLRNIFDTLPGYEDKELVGFYFGLTEKAKGNLSLTNTANAYVFDNYNYSSEELERPFVGLFESLFLEPKGSVKRYHINTENLVERYQYEYIDDSGEVLDDVDKIHNIQQGALGFIEEYMSTAISRYSKMDSEVAFKNLFSVGINPKLDQLEKLGSIVFFNNGFKEQLAKPDCILKYLMSPMKFKKDFLNSQWKTGFLKGVFKLPLPYYEIFKLMRRVRK
ncbi:HAD family hydrolase [Gemella sp.]